MNHIKFIQVGGWPFTLDELDYLQHCSVENQSRLSSAFQTSSDEILVLSGVDLNTTTNTVQDGVIMYAGVPYAVQSHTYVAPSSGEVAYWVPVEEVISGPGTKEFQDGSIHETFYYTHFKVESGATVPPDGVPIANTVLFANRLREIVNNKTWNLFTYNDSDFFFGPGNTPDAFKRRYFKDIDGFVHFKGGYYLDDITSPTNVVICQLPVGFRPPHDIEIPALIPMNEDSAHFTHVRIESSTGNIRILNAKGNGGFYLTQLPPISTKS